ncbi:MAG: penicillin-insensitive murein endopeptidase, partial [Dehalococcoidia bacterium]|nr:penicillin-insensitive murein endopeptidase [Dehalococcoidia bacterium]
FGFFSGTFTIGIIVPGLSELPESSLYDRVGIKPIHPQSHFATSSVLASLTSLAQKYFEAFPGYKLEINDISLPYGGLFDINFDWAPDHVSHRLGTDADVRLVPAGQREKLRRLIYRSGMSKIIVYSDHWHLRQ